MYPGNMDRPPKKMSREDRFQLLVASSGTLSFAGDSHQTLSHAGCDPDLVRMAGQSTRTLRSGFSGCLPEVGSFPECIRVEHIAKLPQALCGSLQLSSPDERYRLIWVDPEHHQCNGFSDSALFIFNEPPIFTVATKDEESSRQTGLNNICRIETSTRSRQREWFFISEGCKRILDCARQFSRLADC